MSELRTQLEQARRDHLAARYPGDLAADLLHDPPTRLSYAAPPRREWLFWTNVGVLGAVAAALVLVFFYLRPTASVVLNPDDDEPVQLISIPKTSQPPATDPFSVVPQLAGASLSPQPAADVVPAAPATFVPSLPSTLVPTTATAVTFPAMPSFPSMTDVLNSATPTDTNTGTKQNQQPSHKETT